MPVGLLLYPLKTLGNLWKIKRTYFRSSRSDLLCKKKLLKLFEKKQSQASNVIKKETLVKLFSCQFLRTVSAIILKLGNSELARFFSNVYYVNI